MSLMVAVVVILLKLKKIKTTQKYDIKRYTQSCKAKENGMYSREIIFVNDLNAISEPNHRWCWEAFNATLQFNIVADGLCDTWPWHGHLWRKFHIEIDATTIRLSNGIVGNAIVNATILLLNAGNLQYVAFVFDGTVWHFLIMVSTPDNCWLWISIGIASQFGRSVDGGRRWFNQNFLDDLWRTTNQQLYRFVLFVFSRLYTTFVNCGIFMCDVFQLRISNEQCENCCLFFVWILTRNLGAMLDITYQQCLARFGYIVS